MGQLEECKQLEQNLRDEGIEVCYNAIEQVERHYKNELIKGETVEIKTFTKRGDLLTIEFPYPYSFKPNEEKRVTLQIKRKNDKDNLHLIREFGILSGDIRVQGRTTHVNILNSSKNPEIFIDENKEQELSNAIVEMRDYKSDVKKRLDFTNPMTTINYMKAQHFGTASHIAMKLNAIKK